MKRRILISIFLFCLLPLAVKAEGLQGCEEHIKYGAPGNSPTLLCRMGYALSHNNEKKVADWVAYHLTKEDMEGSEGRSDDFRPDPDLEEGARSELSDYKKSGYDRGHLAPAASMKWHAVAMSESFLLSNMAPQVGIGFNRHIWKDLETKVREWVTERGELYIVTGPIYSSSTLKYIGKNKVAVPTHFYKVIFDPIQVEAIAFILPNKRLDSKDLPKFITNIDKVEELTGLDFLHKLNDDIENVVEEQIQSSLW